MKSLTPENQFRHFSSSKIHNAAYCGDLKEIRKLINLKFSIEKRVKGGYTPLHAATLGGHFEVAKALIQAGALVSSLTDKKESIFHLLSYVGNVGLMKQFHCFSASLSWLEKGDREGNTALHCSCLLTPKPEIVSYLLAKGAQPLKKNRKGETPLHIAISRRRDGVVHLLLRPDDPSSVERMLREFQQFRNGNDPAGEMYKLFEQAFESGALLDQIFWLERLGQFYFEKKDYVRATHLLSGALALVQPNKNKEVAVNGEYVSFLISKLKRVEIALSRQLTKRKPPSSYRNQLASHRAALRKLRLDVRQLLKKGASIDKIQQTIAEKYELILNAIIKESISLMGKPPERFAVMLLGSLARFEASLFSDIEFAFVIDKSSDKAVKYFRDLDELINLKIIGIGETKYELIRPRKLQDKMREAASLVPSGFSLDSAGLSPRGRPGIYQLIGTPQELARFQTQAWVRKNSAEAILVNAMVTVRSLRRGSSLIEQYQHLVRKTLNEKSLISSGSSFTGGSLRRKRALMLIRGHLEEFQPRLDQSKLYGRDARAFDVKKEFYRPIQSLIGALSQYYGIAPTSTLGRIDQLVRLKVFTPIDGARLKGAFQFAMRLRAEAQSYYCSEKELLYQYRESRDPSALGLFRITSKMQKKIRKLYRILIPLYEAAELFVRGAEGAFSAHALYDLALGVYDPQLRSNQNFSEALKRSQIEAILRPRSSSAQSDLGVIQADLGSVDKSLQNALRSIEIMRKKYKNIPHPSLASGLMNLGSAYDCRGEYQKAVETYQLALNMFNQLYPLVCHPDIADCLGNMGNAYVYMGKYDKAVAFFDRSLKISRVVCKGEPNLSVAIVLNSLGSALDYLGRYREALSRFEEASEILNEIYKDRPHTHVAVHYHNFAVSLAFSKEYSRSVEYFKLSIKTKEKIYSTRLHPSIALGLTGLGTVYRLIDEHEKAIEHYKEALKINRSIYKNGAHDSIASNLCNLGNAYQDLGDLKNAITCFSDSVSLYRRIHKSRAHPSLAVSLSALGTVHFLSKQYSKALEELKEAERIFRSVYSDGKHLHLAHCLIMLGHCYSLLEREDSVHRQSSSSSSSNGGRSHQGARRCYQNSFDIYSYQEGVDSTYAKMALHYLTNGFDELDDQGRPSISSLNSSESNQSPKERLFRLGSLYDSKGELAKAVYYFEEYAKLEKDSSPNFADALMWLGRIYDSQGKLAVSQRYYERSLKMKRALHGLSPRLDIAGLLLNLGNSYYFSKDYSRALDSHTASLKAYRSLFGEKHPLIARCLNSLGMDYYGLGDHSAALKLEKESLEMNRRLFGTQSHSSIADNLNNLGLIYAGLVDLKKAIDHYNQALELYRKFGVIRFSQLSANCLMNLGEAHRHSNSPKKAIECYELALDLKPNLGCDRTQSDRAGILLNLGISYACLDSHAKAMECWKSSLKEYRKLHGAMAHPSMIAVCRNMGALFASLKDSYQAINYYKKSISMSRELCDSQPNSSQSASSEPLQVSCSSDNSSSPARDQVDRDVVMGLANDLMHLGQLYGSVGEISKEVKNYMEALNLKRRLYGKSPRLDVAGILLNLGRAHFKLKKFVASEKFSIESLQLYRLIHKNKPDASIVNCLFNLSAIYDSLNRQEKSSQFLSECKKMKRALFADDQKRFLAQCSDRKASGSSNEKLDLKEVLVSSEDVDQQIKRLEERLQLDLKLYGEEPHLVVADTLRKLGALYNLTENYEKSIEYCHRVVKMVRKIFKMSSCSSIKGCLEAKADCLNTLGTIYSVRGEYRLATACLRDALRTYGELHRGAPHVDLAVSLSNLGAAYAASYQFDAALDQFQKSLKVRSKLWPSGSHRDLADVWHDLGGVYFHLGETQKSAEAYEKALEIDRKLGGERASSDLASSLGNLGMAYSILDKHSQALECHKKALKMTRSLHHHRSHPAIAMSLMNLGLAYSSLGDAVKSVQYQKHSLMMLRDLYGSASTPDIAKNLSNLGGAYKELGKLKKAMEHYKKAVKMKREIYGEKPNLSTARSLLGIAICYKLLKEFDESLDYYRQSYDLFLKTVGKEHPFAKRIYISIAELNSIKLQKERQSKK